MNKHSVTGEVKVLGIDLSKRSFQLHGADQYGKVVLRKKLSRKQLLKSMANLAPCVVGMEACGGAHYWARKFQELGHQVHRSP